MQGSSIVSLLLRKRLFTTPLRLFSLKSGSIRYTKSHEYIKLMNDTNKVRIGISNHAQAELGMYDDTIDHVQYCSAVCNILYDIY